MSYAEVEGLLRGLSKSWLRMTGSKLLSDQRIEQIVVDKGG